MVPAGVDLEVAFVISRLDQPDVWIGALLGRKMKQGPVWGRLIGGSDQEVEPRRFPLRS
jgi:hypothetical protein